ncbi:hypothetical protein [Vulcanisaeta souniana]|uniref:Uncharacterized protein n=1 Tax=Vulcanisaeta souniana JCM 11219 TaxID=1293586 RepID=A0A830DYY1_9CREN|nr:hypothetical protein [Vulcanisaeta souniana]BDR91803.1 hypothetical protein Vsou_08960 [Vulcanisaeta souniana JCM 11219]GGI70251.1 hypothetical protein GCM10007112_04030 [Vulcanisaeta souniana JCM 11219]
MGFTTLDGYGLQIFPALVQSLISYPLIEWSSIRRIVGALAAMCMIFALLMGILPTVLNSVGLTAVIA